MSDIQSDIQNGRIAAAAGGGCDIGGQREIEKLSLGESKNICSSNFVAQDHGCRCGLHTG
ncbi:hypothetical protein [Bradyrhizobium sp. 2TAF24]|uniref:hypothetical protein n=1 Tax=Bradyrhizobium sp. 2TAF24 TaxID=3233011 RepID=UPI003F92B564